MNISSNIIVLEVPFPAQTIKKIDTVKIEKNKIRGRVLALYGRERLSSVVGAFLSQLWETFWVVGMVRKTLYH